MNVNSLVALMKVIGRQGCTYDISQGDFEWAASERKEETV